MTPNEALSEIEFLAAHEAPARASELGRILREEMAEMARIRAERDSLKTALAQAERELERIRSARKMQRVLVAQARDTLERLIREVGV